LGLFYVCLDYSTSEAGHDHCQTSECRIADLLFCCLPDRKPGSSLLRCKTFETGLHQISSPGGHPCSCLLDYNNSRNAHSHICDVPSGGCLGNVNNTLRCSPFPVISAAPDNRQIVYWSVVCCRLCCMDLYTVSELISIGLTL